MTATNGSEYKKRMTAWCPDCGNLAILDAVKESLEAMNTKQREVTERLIEAFI